MAVTYTDGSGKKRAKGGKDLKSSQSYPTRLLSYLSFLHFFLDKPTSSQQHLRFNEPVSE